MALKQCYECGHQVSTQAAACPSCGAAIKPAKRKTNPIIGCIGIFLLLGFGLLVVAALFSSSSDTASSASVATKPQAQKTAPKAAPKQTEFAQEETFRVGYTAYMVHTSQWSDRISTNQFANTPPNAHYLLVGLSVRNDDKKARVIPPFVLIDENGAEYQTSPNGWAVENALGVIETLNPGVSKTGIIVFDIPKEHTYKLKVSGGYWSAEDAFVVLKPE